MTVCTAAHNLSQSWARSIHSTPSQPISIKSILPFTFRSSKFFFLLGFPAQPLYAFYSPYMPHVQPILFFHFVNLTIFGEQYQSWSTSLHAFLHSPATSSLSGTDITLCTPFSTTLYLPLPSVLSRCFKLNLTSIHCCTFHNLPMFCTFQLSLCFIWHSLVQILLHTRPVS